MPEYQPGLSPESSLEDASRLFGTLTDMVLRSSTWTPWHRYGERRRCQRVRDVGICREVPTTYSSIIRPRHNDPKWSGPVYTLEAAEGQVTRKLVIRQVEQAPFECNWLRRVLLPPDMTSYDIEVTNKEAVIPEFTPPRSLTDIEAESLVPYGGGSHQVIFNDQKLRETRFKVQRMPSAMKKVQEFRQVGSFTQVFTDIDTLPGLIAVNQVLHKEIYPEITASGQ